MEIVYAKPPNYERVASAFNLEDHPGVIFTYGNKIYVPAGDKLKIDKPLMRHEETHARQQRDIGIEEWWDKFITEPEFRLSQELEAYREQYRNMADLDAPSRMGYLNHICSDLSGEMYGNIMTHEEARVAITDGIVLKHPRLGGRGGARGSNVRKAKKVARQNRKKGRK